MAKAATDYRVSKRRDGRYQVVGPKGKPINGEEKTKILSDKGLITLSKPGKKEEPAATESEDTTAEDTAAKDTTTEEKNSDDGAAE